MATGTKGNPPKGTRPSGTAAAGAAGTATSDPSLEAAKKILARFGNDPAKVAKAFGELEKKLSEQGQQIANFAKFQRSLEPIADRLEMDPVSGGLRIKEADNNGTPAPKKNEEFKAAIAKKLTEAMSKKDAAETINTMVDAMIETATRVATEQTQGLSGAVSRNSIAQNVDRFVRDNPKYKGMSAYLVDWYARQPESVQRSVQIDEAAELIHRRLVKNGVIEESETEDTDEVKPGTTALSGGSGPAPSGNGALKPGDERSDEDIKAGIKSQSSVFDKFLENSRQRRLGQNPNAESGDGGLRFSE